MLINGTTLGYRKHGTTGDYTDLPGLKETPTIGSDPEKVQNTSLTDAHHIYEMGIGDLSDMVYKFKYDNTSADSPYRKMRAAQQAGEVLDFQEKLKDGSITEFAAQVYVKRTGGSVNGVVEFELTMIVQSELDFTDPV